MKEFKDKLVFNLGEERGLVGQVAQNGQTINVNDTSKEPNWIDLDPAIKSALFTPVQVEKVILGVFALFSKEKNAFTEEDEHDITLLANNLAIGIENARNQERVKKHLTRMSALHNIDLAINSSTDLHTTLNIFLEHVTTQLKIDAADVLLSRLNTSTYEFTAGRGFNTHEIENSNIRAGMSLDKKVALKRGIIYLTGLTDQEISPSFTAMWAAEGFSTYLGGAFNSKRQSDRGIGSFPTCTIRPRSGMDRLF